MMINKNKELRLNYLSRIAVLPLAAVLFVAFTLRTQKIDTALELNYHGKKMIVIIDAGHGGMDLGASSNNGRNEKDLTLQIANKIHEINQNSAIELVLSRENDRTISPKERVNFSIAQHANLFISIHLDASPNSAPSGSGLSVYIPNNAYPFLQQSKLLGMMLVQRFQSNYELPVNLMLQQRKGTWVLNSNQSPSVLIEAGYITNEKDLDYLSNENNQERIAKSILLSINQYFVSQGK